MNWISFCWYQGELCLVKPCQPVLIHLSVVVFMGRTSGRLVGGAEGERVNGALIDGAAFLVACNPGGYPGQPGVRESLLSPAAEVSNIHAGSSERPSAPLLLEIRSLNQEIGTTPGASARPAAAAAASLIERRSLHYVSLWLCSSAPRDSNERMMRLTFFSRSLVQEEHEEMSF